TDDPLAMYLADVYTVSANLAGIPGISLNAGEVEGLPVGLQLLAANKNEDILVKVANAYEQIYNQ
ncbi:MAG: Glutamyl-tRNA(Gln) amidotransferase subunit A, partial [Parcubacteria group bacterium GW2011_GWA2_40_8]